MRTCSSCLRSSRKLQSDIEVGPLGVLTSESQDHSPRDERISSADEYMKVEIFDSLEACQHLRSEWNSFAERCGDDISLTFEWHRALAASQPLAEQLRVLWIYEGEELQAILPLCMARRSLRWVPLRHLIPLGSFYCAHDNLLLRSVSLDRLCEALDVTVSTLAPWDVFSFSLSDSTQLYSQLDERHPSEKYWIDLVAGKASPYLTLEGNAEDFASKLGTKMRTNIRARLKRLRSAGEVELVALTSLSDVTDALETIRSIELRSWKHSAGTSITANPIQIRFYDTLMRELAANGTLLVFLLLLGGKPIAHDLGFVYKNRFFSGKTSFVDEIRHLQPGFILRWLIINALYGRGISEHDFMGDSEAHKMQWTQTVRRHRDVLFYRKGALSGASLAFRHIARLRKGSVFVERQGGDLL